MPTHDKESAFAELVQEYENLWVAIDTKDGIEFVVASGRDAVEAAREAEGKGFADAVLFKIPSFSRTFVP